MVTALLQKKNYSSSWNNLLEKKTLLAVLHYKIQQLFL